MRGESFRQRYREREGERVTDTEEKDIQTEMEGERYSERGRELQIQRRYSDRDGGRERERGRES